MQKCLIVFHIRKPVPTVDSFLSLKQLSTSFKSWLLEEGKVQFSK